LLKEFLGSEIRRQESGLSGQVNRRKKLLQPLNHAFKVIDGVHEDAPGFLELHTASGVWVKGVADFPNDELGERIARTRPGTSRVRIKILGEIAVVISFVGEVR